MLNAPLFIRIHHIGPLINDQVVDVAAHLCQVGHEFDELVLVFGELLEGQGLGLAFGELRICWHVLLDYSLEVGFGGFDEVFDDVEEEVEAVYVYFL